jgi:hypothetical protein
MERVYEELSRASGWMKAMGILSIVGGILSAITIVGIGLFSMMKGGYGY